MPSADYGPVFRQVNRLFDRGTSAGMDERLLLERFVSRRDEAAFEALVARFGPMVLGVCRRRLADSHDVEDAFQATFLILVRKAATIRDGDHLSNWLYGVAYRVAARAHDHARRRRSLDDIGVEPAAVAPEQAYESDRIELKAILDEELSRLPEKYRAPLVLCNLEGQSYEEAASRLRCPIGTVRSRTAKARELMRTRLVRRGFALPAGAIAAALAPTATQAAIPPALLTATVTAAMCVVTGGAVSAGLVSAGVVALCQELMTHMFLTRLRWTAGLALVAGIAGLGTAAMGWQVDRDGPRPLAKAPDRRGGGGRAGPGRLRKLRSPGGRRLGREAGRHQVRDGPEGRPTARGRREAGGERDGWQLLRDADLPGGTGARAELVAGGRGGERQRLGPGRPGRGLRPGDRLRHRGDSCPPAGCCGLRLSRDPLAR